jgi:hypothetical protein
VIGCCHWLHLVDYPPDLVGTVELNNLNVLVVYRFDKLPGSHQRTAGFGISGLGSI